MEKHIVPPELVQPVFEILSYIFTALVGWILGKKRGVKQESKNFKR